MLTELLWGVVKAILGLIFSWNFLGLVLSAVVGYSLYFYAKQALDRANGRRPPGPWGLPYFGSLFSVDHTAFHKFFERMNLTYGPIVHMDMGVKPTVLIQDPDLLKTVYKNPISNGRKPDEVADMWRDENWGMFFRDGDAGWRLQRKHAVKAMQLYSSAKNARLSKACDQSLQGFYAFLDTNEGKPIEIRNELFHLTGSIAMEMVYGLETGYEDERQREVTKYSSEMMTEFANTMILGFLPILKPFFFTILRRQREGVAKFTNFCKKLIAEHNYDGGELRTVADALKKAMAEVSEEDLEAAGLVKADLESIAIDLYTAGMFDTAENTIWFLVLLAAHPEFQEEMVAEIQALTGGNRAVESADQASLVLCQAGVNESIRFASTVPFTMPHNLMADMEVGPYKVAKDTEIMGNAWMMHRDPKIYPEPEKFKPERWVKEGRFNTELSNNIFAFSTGGRRCPGEGFAKQEIFVLVANIAQRYRLSLDPNTPGDALEHQYNLTMAPGPHKLIFHKR